jgi:hypothetical protein
MSVSVNKAIRMLPAWLAALAVLFLTIAPPAVALGSMGGVWYEVCTSQGMKRLQVGGDPAGPTNSGKGHSHCPLCSPYAQTLAPPPAGRMAVPVAGLCHEPARLAEHALRSALVQTVAQPRAPPASS